MLSFETAKLDGVFHALADSTRRAILKDIARGEKTVGEVAKPYPMSLAAVSKHLNVLEAAGLIAREKRGSFQVVHIKADALRNAREWLDYYERFWDERLNALQTLLEGQDHE